MRAEGHVAMDRQRASALWPTYRAWIVVYDPTDNKQYASSAAYGWSRRSACAKCRKRVAEALRAFGIKRVTWAKGE